MRCLTFALGGVVLCNILPFCFIALTFRARNDSIVYVKFFVLFVISYFQLRGKSTTQMVLSSRDTMYLTEVNKLCRLMPIFTVWKVFFSETTDSLDGFYFWLFFEMTRDDSLTLKYDALVRRRITYNILLPDTYKIRHCSRTRRNITLERHLDPSHRNSTWEFSDFPREKWTVFPKRILWMCALFYGIHGLNSFRTYPAVGPMLTTATNHQAPDKGELQECNWNGQGPG